MALDCRGPLDLPQKCKNKRRQYQSWGFTKWTWGNIGMGERQLPHEWGRCEADNPEVMTDDRLLTLGEGRQAGEGSILPSVGKVEDINTLWWTTWAFNLATSTYSFHRDGREKCVGVNILLIWTGETLGLCLSRFLSSWENYLTTNTPQHPSLEGIGMLWVRAQESRQHPVALDTKPNKMTVVVRNLYGSFFFFYY